MELDPFNAIARFKLGTVQVEQGDAEKGKASILEALRQKPDLKEADYYLGRAEARLGNDAAAVESFSRSISSSSDPEVVQLAWYQLAMSYRRMHRTSEAQQALTMFQKLKDESSERAQERLQTNRASSGQNTAPPPEPQKPK